jgi:hypothetical protein
MAEKNILGIYWGHDKLYCVLTSEDPKPLRTFSIDIDAESTSELNNPDFDIGQRIQSVLKEQNISVSSVNLALSTKDTIYRTFVIPWVQNSEVKALVEFEASKYLPFSLEELTFAYQATTFTENSQKRLRILFVAIKKSTIEGYIDKLEQAGLAVDAIEPAPTSLVRMLVSRQMLNLDATVAIIIGTASNGKIAIVNQSLPYFVREFQMATNADASEGGFDNNLVRFINEVRISCDYFNRQSPQLGVSEAVVLAGNDSEKLAANLKEDLSFPVLPIEYDKLMDQMETPDSGYVIAYGISMVDKVQLTANLFLGQRRAKTSRAKNLSGNQGLNVKWVALTSAICLGLIISTYMMVNKTQAPLRKKLTKLESKLGAKAKQKIAAIRKEIDEKRDKIKDLNNIRFKSDISGFLAILPELLPEGAWLKNLEIVYPDSKAVANVKTTKKNTRSKIRGKSKAKNDDEEKESIVLSKVPEIVIEGYVYLDNINEQFGVVNKFLTRITESQSFKDNYQKITLDSVKTEKMNNFPVTYFKILCKEK